MRDNLLEPQPRFDLPSEQATLGAMLLEREAIRRAASVVEADDFYSPPHRILFAAMLTLYQRDEPVDMVTVQAELANQDKLEGVGGIDYILSLQSAAPTAASVSTYARTVKRHSIARAQIKAAQSFVLGVQRNLSEEELAAHYATLATALEMGATSEDGILTAEALLRMDVKTEWLVHNLIPLGGLTVVAGDGGIGKSFLALSLAHAVTNGLHWLGKYSTRKGNALYIDFENPEAGQKERLALLDRGAGIQSPTELEESDPFGDGYPESLYWWFRPLDLTAARIGRLESVIRERRLNLVVLDSWSKLIPGINENDNTQVTLALMPVLRLARRIPWCALVLIHHFGKPRGDLAEANLVQHRVRGASALRDNVDAAFTMSGTPDGRDRRIDHMKARLVMEPEAPFLVEIRQVPSGGVEVVHAGGAEQISVGVQAKLQELIQEDLAVSPRMRQDLLRRCRETLDGQGVKFDDKTFGRALHALTKAGTITNQWVGNAKRFELVEEVDPWG